MWGKKKLFSNSNALKFIICVSNAKKKKEKKKLSHCVGPHVKINSCLQFSYK